MAFQNREKYGEAIASLIAEDRLNPLDGGELNGAVFDQLQALTLGSAFGGAKLADPTMAEAVISGLWLYHNYLDRSHTISQAIDTPTGSFWHGIMHRREPDASNSAYWFRRVGEHPVFAALRDAARREAEAGDSAGEAGFLLSQKNWDPFAFIDLCESCRGKEDDTEDLCRRIQLREWELLFDFSFESAVNPGSHATRQ